MGEAEQVETTHSQRQAKGGGARNAYETLRGEILSFNLAPRVPLKETSLADRLAHTRQFHDRFAHFMRASSIHELDLSGSLPR